MDRWQRRGAFEALRARQASAPDPAHELRLAALSPEALVAVRNRLVEMRPLIGRAFLVRRVLPADPGAETYVVGVTMGHWKSFNGTETDVLQRLAGQRWPVHVLVCSLDADRATLRRMMTVPGSEIRFDDRD